MGAAAREDSRCGLRNSRFRFGEATRFGYLPQHEGPELHLGSRRATCIRQHEERLLPTLREGLQVSERADFCVGYLNLRGSRRLADCVDGWDGGPEHCCRLLIGMHVPPHDELREALSLGGGGEGLDNQAAMGLKRRLAEQFREQLLMGAPTAVDETGLRRLAAQLRGKRVVVRLFLRHPLHAKLYLLFRSDPHSPIIGYVGSSNLTLSGLSEQGS